jgi:hypothetical protein
MRTTYGQGGGVIPPTALPPIVLQPTVEQKTLAVLEQILKVDEHIEKLLENSQKHWINIADNTYQRGKK